MRDEATTNHTLCVPCGGCRRHELAPKQGTETRVGVHSRHRALVYTGEGVQGGGDANWGGRNGKALPGGVEWDKPAERAGPGRHGAAQRGWGARGRRKQIAYFQLFFMFSST